MASKPRKASRPKLKVVGHIGTPENVVDLLSEVLGRAEEDELLAVAVVEVRRGGDIDYHSAGTESGFRHQLYAGCGYLMRNLEEDE